MRKKSGAYFFWTFVEEVLGIHIILLCIIDITKKKDLPSPTFRASKAGTLVRVF